MQKITILTILFFIIQLPVISQSNPSQVIRASVQKIRNGKADEAIADLNELIKENPDHFGALSTLGFAFRNKKKYEKSVEAYERAIKSQPDNARGMFNLGVAYALANDKDKAFEMMMNVKNGNAFNITNVGSSPAAAILKDDPRYKKLFPGPKEYSDPFTEKEANIIHEWKGENAGDQFGWIGRNVGDVDGDGIPDVTSSAPTNNEGGPRIGCAATGTDTTSSCSCSRAPRSRPRRSTSWSCAGPDPGGPCGSTTCPCSTGWIPPRCRPPASGS